MKKVKSVLSMVMMFSLILGMTACDSKNAQNESKPSTIIVASGISSVPNTYVEKGEHKGHEVDIWNEIAKKSGLKVEFVKGEFNTLFGYLDSGKADTVGNAITKNQARIEKYDFSETYAYIPEKLVVHTNRTDIKKLVDIDGLVCGYSSGSNGGNLFQQIAKAHTINIQMAVYDSSELLNEAFRQGKVEVMILAGSEAAYKIKQGFADARMVEEDIAVGEKAYPFKKNDPRSKFLSEAVTKAIIEMKHDGSLEKIYQKWYGLDFSHAPSNVNLAK